MMKSWSLRTQLGLNIALLVLGVLAVFGTVSGFVIYEEQLDVLEDLMEDEPLSEQQEEAWDVLEDLLTGYAIAFPAAACVAGLGAWWLLRRGLFPLESIVTAAEQIDRHGLGTRLPECSTNDEIGRLTTVFNAMLARLERAFQQNIRFTADASHELRTPLTILRGEIEGTLQQTHGGTVSAEILGDLLEQVQRVSDITEKLLLLTNADAGRLIMEKTPVNLSGLCAGLIEDAEILGSAKDITIEARVESGVTVEADEHAISRVLLNLLDNAIKYNEPGGRVCFELRAQGDRAVIEIGNTGPAIPPELREAIFDRFVRVNTSRSRETGGSGLGLSICRELLAAHGGELRLRESEAGWTVFCLLV